MRPAYGHLHKRKFEHRASSRTLLIERAACTTSVVCTFPGCCWGGAVLRHGSKVQSSHSPLSECWALSQSLRPDAYEAAGQVARHGYHIRMACCGKLCKDLAGL